MLTNDEVIDVNQYPSGKQAVPVFRADLSITGPQEVRDLWRQKEVGQFGATVGRHGAAMFRMKPPASAQHLRRH